MIPHQFALVRREVWEHRSLWLTPAAVALVMTLMLLTGYIFASGYKELVDIGIVGAQNLAAEEHRRSGLTAFLMGYTVVFVIASAILTIFYCLDSLYAERKNKSILFWRSLPITDAETVISKLLTAFVAIPVITFVVIAAAHLVNLILMSIFIGIEGGRPGYMIWQSAPSVVRRLDGSAAGDAHVTSLVLAIHWLVSVRIGLDQALAAVSGISAVVRCADARTHHLSYALHR